VRGADVASLVTRVTARAGAETIGPYVDGVLRLRVAAPPLEGAANEAVRRLVARQLGIGVGRIHLMSGRRARTKRFAVDGLTDDEVLDRLGGPPD
jgi:uncharacterized protein YggU (UPF0235/DUF167 family)